MLATPPPPRTHSSRRRFVHAGTAVAFDQLGCGYRVVQLSAASVNVTYKALLNGGGSPGCKKHDPTDDR